MNRSDDFWMSRCLNLAKRGTGYVSPNPLVGAVIVRNGIKIAEGFHSYFGGHHAEINAIHQALKKKHSLLGATLFVNLEPCFHFGKTPPCVDAIIQNGITRVVIAKKDPNPLVAGKSIKKLKQNGVQCKIGVLEREAELLNEKFFKFIETEKPFVSLKAAQTYDGFIALEDGTSKWITNKLSRKYVHQLRSEYDAIIIGAHTVNIDDPELTVRNVKGRNPIRVVIDGKLSVNVNSKVFNEKAPTIVYTSRSKTIKSKIINDLESKGVVVVQLKSKNGILKINDVLLDLGKHQISSALVEGGAKTHSEFLNSGMVDKVYLFTAKKVFGKGIKTFGDISKPLMLRKNKQRYFGNDLFEEYSILKA